MQGLGLILPVATASLVSLVGLAANASAGPQELKVISLAPPPNY